MSFRLPCNSHTFCCSRSICWEFFTFEGWQGWVPTPVLIANRCHCRGLYKGCGVMHWDHFKAKMVLHMSCVYPSNNSSEILKGKSTIKAQSDPGRKPLLSSTPALWKMDLERLWITSTAPAEPAGWEGWAWGIRGVVPGKANSADPSHLCGEEEECQGFF